MVVVEGIITRREFKLSCFSLAQIDINQDVQDVIRRDLSLFSSQA